MQNLLPSSTADGRGAQGDLPADGQTAVRALVEGDAVLVQNMYQATTIQNPAELASLEQEEAAARGVVDFENLPYVVFQTTYFPYLHGPGFIHAVLGDGPLTTYGQYGPAIDRVFRRPPTSTSQILHPERYRDGVDPVPVALPDLSGPLGGEWVALGEGLLGEFDHRLILDNFLRATEPERAARASGGWMGDRTAVFRQRDPGGAPLGDLAVVLKTRWATPEDVQAWAQAYADSVALRFADPVRYAGRESLLQQHALGTNRLGWVMPGERAIVLAWTRQHSAIAIAPDLTLAHALAEQALAGE
jgi:hypothetical protein